MLNSFEEMLFSNPNPHDWNDGNEDIYTSLRDIAEEMAYVKGASCDLDDIEWACRHRGEVCESLISMIIGGYVDA